MAFLAVSRSQFIPTLENYFGLGIEDERELRTGDNLTSEQTWDFTKEVVVWKNPYWKSAINPYIPSEKNNALIKTFQLAINANPIALEESLFSNPDVTTLILLNVDLKTFINFSEVNKCCYLATQVNVLWEGQLSQLLPLTKCISSELCSFTPDQQFKIIHRRVIDESKPFTAKYKRNEEKCLELKEQMAKINIRFKEAGGKEAVDRYQELFSRNISTFMVGTPDDVKKSSAAWEKSKDKQAYALYSRWGALETQLSLISGKNDDGTAAPTPENCSQEKLLNAINVLVPDTFNNQVKFDKVIRQAEVAKNINSALSAVTVEDVTDVAEPTEAKGT